MYKNRAYRVIGSKTFGLYNPDLFDENYICNCRYSYDREGYQKTELTAVNSSWADPKEYGCFYTWLLGMKLDSVASY